LFFFLPENPNKPIKRKKKKRDEESISEKENDMNVNEKKEEDMKARFCKTEKKIQ